MIFNYIHNHNNIVDLYGFYSKIQEKSVMVVYNYKKKVWLSMTLSFIFKLMFYYRLKCSIDKKDCINLPEITFLPLFYPQKPNIQVHANILFTNSPSVFRPVDCQINKWNIYDKHKQILKITPRGKRGIQDNQFSLVSSRQCDLIVIARMFCCIQCILFVSYFKTIEHFHYILHSYIYLKV